MNKYFYIDESPVYKEKFLIRVNGEKFIKFFPSGMSGSYNVLIGRVAGMSYATFLRYCRDVLNGEIIGKGHKYPVVFFDRSEDLVAFVKLLNKNMEFLEHLYDHPYEFKRNEEGILERVALPFKDK